METEDMRLESAVLQLNPARSRCELMVRLPDGEEQSLGTGLVETFVNHLGAVREQILESGSRSIKLQPEDGEDSSWFTKDTFERFLKFVNSPEVLERAVGVRDELSRLVNSASLSDEGASTREELETRRCMLEKELAASGFTKENVRKLHLFASKFGDAALLIACENYMAGYSEETEAVDYISSSLDQVSASVLSKRSGAPLVARGENGVGEIAAGVISDRKLSVQEKISMFERTMGAGNDDARRSMDVVDRLGVQKSVLRRWSLAENSRGGRGGPTSRETEAIAEDTETGSSSGQPTEELNSRASQPAESGNRSEDCASPQSDSLRSLFCPLKSEQKLSGIAEGRDDDQHSVASDTQSLIDKKGRLYDQYRQRRDAKLREEPGSRRAERQAKLKKMQESLERRRGEIARAATKVNPLVEAQVRAAKLRAFKAGLVEMKKEKEEEEKKRLEALRLQRQKQAAAATQSPRSPHSGASTPRTGVPTKQIKGFLPTFQRAANTGTNNSTGTRNPQVSMQPQQPQQQPQQQQLKLPAKGQKTAALATAATMQPVKKAVDGGAAVSRLRKPTSTAALRKSLSSLTEAQGLKLSTQLMSDAAEDAERSGIYARRRSESFRIPSSSATEPAKGLATAIAATEASEPAASAAVIRARVTVDDDDVTGFGGGDNDEFRPSAEEETEDEEEAAAVEYKAPLAPVSAATSPMLLQGS